MDKKKIISKIDAAFNGLKDGEEKRLIDMGKNLSFDRGIVSIINKRLYDTSVDYKKDDVDKYVVSSNFVNDVIIANKYIDFYLSKETYIYYEFKDIIENKYNIKIDSFKKEELIDICDDKNIKNIIICLYDYFKEFNKESSKSITQYSKK